MTLKIYLNYFKKKEKKNMKKNLILGPRSSLEGCGPLF